MTVKASYLVFFVSFYHRASKNQQHEVVQVKTFYFVPNRISHIKITYSKRNLKIWRVEKVNILFFMHVATHVCCHVFAGVFQGKTLKYKQSQECREPDKVIRNLNWYGHA